MIPRSSSAYPSLMNCLSYIYSRGSYLIPYLSPTLLLLIPHSYPALIPHLSPTYSPSLFHFSTLIPTDPPFLPQ